jgi:hypothetical protein
MFDILRLPWEIYLYHRKLQMDIIDVHHIGTYGGLSLLLVYVAFANPSSRTYSVGRVEWFAPFYIGFLKVPQPQGRSNDELLIYRLPTCEDIETKLPPHELLQSRFDIPPNQSLGRWCPLLIHSDVEIRYNLPIPLTVKAFGVSTSPKPLAKAHRKILLSS